MPIEQKAIGIWLSWILLFNSPIRLWIWTIFFIVRSFIIVGWKYSKCINPLLKIYQWWPLNRHNKCKWIFSVRMNFMNVLVSIIFTIFGSKSKMWISLIIKTTEVIRIVNFKADFKSFQWTFRRNYSNKMNKFTSKSDLPYDHKTHIFWIFYQRSCYYGFFSFIFFKIQNCSFFSLKKKRQKFIIIIQSSSSLTLNSISTQKKSESKNGLKMIVIAIFHR